MKKSKQIILGLLWALTSHAEGIAVLKATPSTVVLAVNNPELNLVLTGRAREVRIENTGDVTARNVKYVSVHLPEGMSIAPLQCGHLKPKESCVLRITPGLSASDKAEIHIKSDNTEEALLVPVRVLTYGSMHEGGYVFAIEDDAARVKGKVLAVRDQISPVPGVVWSANGRSGRAQDAVFNAIPQVYDSSLQNCHGKIDGACNTTRIVDYYSRPTQHVPVALQYYAAGVCKQYVTDSNGHPCAGQQCLDDWYLPAICELDRVSALIPESIVCPAETQNVVENLSHLIDINCVGPQCLSGSYWSSTAHYNRSYPEYSAWDEDFNVSGSSQYNDDKNNQYGVRCARAF